MKKIWITAVLAFTSLPTLAASPEVFQAAMLALNQANAALIQSKPEAARPAMEVAQSQWIAWAQLDCKAVNGLDVQQQYSMNTDPFGSCMVEQMQRRTEQLQARMQQ